MLMIMFAHHPGEIDGTVPRGPPQVIHGCLRNESEEKKVEGHLIGEHEARSGRRSRQTTIYSFKMNREEYDSQACRVSRKQEDGCTVRLWLLLLSN